MKKKSKKTTFSLLLLLIFAIFSWIFEQTQQHDSLSTYTTRPFADSQEAILYANQNHDDLTRLYVDAIHSARHSIHLTIYALTDPQIIDALRKVSENGVSVRVVADIKASPYLDEKLGPKIDTVRRFGPGLMHQKVLVIDKKSLLIGSANLTPESLRMHGNLVTAVECAPAAELAVAKMQSMKAEGKCPAYTKEIFQLGSQQMELWFLPDNKQAVQHLQKLLAEAKKSIQVAMFTWTHHSLATSVIQASERGVKVQVVIDNNAGKGSSAKIVKLFKQKGIDVSLSRGDGLLHHKFLLIDQNLLINGSANWTKNAFHQNDDCFIILTPLNPSQQAQMQHLWHTITRGLCPLPSGRSSCGSGSGRGR